MTDEQFKEMMKKLEDIERAMKDPQSDWQRMFRRPIPQQPQYFEPAPWPHWPQATD